MPGVFDEKRKARFICLVERGRPPRLAAEDIDISFATIRNHLASDPGFRQAFQDAGDLATDRVEEVAYDMATSGDNAGMTKFWLVNRRSHQWVETTKQVQVTGAGGGPIQLATGTVETWRKLLQDPEARTEALAFANEIPAIEATAHET